MKLTNKRGFTITEIIVAMALFAIMAAMVGMIISGASMSSAKNKVYYRKIQDQNRDYSIGDLEDRGLEGTDKKYTKRTEVGKTVTIHTTGGPVPLTLDNFDVYIPNDGGVWNLKGVLPSGDYTPPATISSTPSEVEIEKNLKSVCDAYGSYGLIVKYKYSSNVLTINITSPGERPASYQNYCDVLTFRMPSETTVVESGGTISSATTKRMTATGATYTVPSGKFVKEEKDSSGNITAFHFKNFDGFNTLTNQTGKFVNFEVAITLSGVANTDVIRSNNTWYTLTETPAANKEFVFKDSGPPVTYEWLDIAEMPGVYLDLGNGGTDSGNGLYK